MIDPRLVPGELQQLVTSLADADATGRVNATRPARRGAGSRRAAVLIMIAEDTLDITFTERAATLRTHPGQMSFPGGAVDPGESAVQAALREAHEEIGLEPARATVLGQLPASHVAASGFDVAAVVALWDGDPQELGLDEAGARTCAIRPVNAAEVASVHRFRIDELADPSHRVSWRIPGGHKGPGFVLGDIFIWGFTAHLVDCLLQLGGFTREWDRSLVAEVPQRFHRR